LEEQKKLSDKSLVGKDAKCAKAKEGSSLTKALTKKTITPPCEDVPAKIETTASKSDIHDDAAVKGDQVRVVNPEHTKDERQMEWLKISRCPLQANGRGNENFAGSSEPCGERVLRRTTTDWRSGSDILDSQSSLEQFQRADTFPLLNMQRQTNNVPGFSPPTSSVSNEKIPSEDFKTQNDFDSKFEKHLTTINRKLTDNRQKVMSEYRQRLDEINEHMELWYNNEKEKTIDPERKQRIINHLYNFKMQFESMKEESKDFENHIGLQMPISPATVSRTSNSKICKIQDNGL